MELVNGASFAELVILNNYIKGEESTYTLFFATLFFTIVYFVYDNKIS
jgi:hypothetical protein